MKISDKVVCVDDSPHRYTKQVLLERGKVYVVEDVDTTPRPCGTLGLFLVGVPNYVCPFSGELLGWRASRFRLIDEMKAEASVLQVKDKQPVIVK